MWCGAPPPDGALMAPCCLLAAIVLAWTVVALGAFAHGAAPNKQNESDAVVIVAIAGTLLHLAPTLADATSLLLSFLMAAHAAVIVVVLAIDARAAREHT